MTRAFEDYNQLRVLKRPLTGVYLSFFLMVTLMILVGSVWMGTYLAKRITRPVQLLAAAAREIGAGCKDAVFVGRLEKIGVDPVCSTPAAFSQAIREDLVTWKEAVAAAGMTRQ